MIERFEDGEGRANEGDEREGGGMMTAERSRLDRQEGSKEGRK